MKDVTNEEIMFSIFKDHVYGFIFEYDFLQSNDICMGNLFVELPLHQHMPDAGLIVLTPISRMALWLIPV